MALLGLLATWIPARCALSVDPMILLREESDATSQARVVLDSRDGSRAFLSTFCLYQLKSVVAN
jgi:hypothetical protein